MNKTIVSPIKDLGQVSPVDLSELKEWPDHLPKPVEQTSLFSSEQAQQNSDEPNIGYQEGQPIKYWYPKDRAWIDAIFKGVNVTSFCKPGQFTYIEVMVKNYSMKAYSLSQIKPC